MFVTAGPLRYSEVEAASPTTSTSRRPANGETSCALHAALTESVCPSRHSSAVIVVTPVGG